MFDDYDYKNTDKRILMRFVQERDEPMYPWEIAAFLNRLNTVYYKYDLLNSVCSALNHGIAPTDIFIFDQSLPLYRRYAAMNLLNERFAAKHFYSVGLPYPLVPSPDIYAYNLLYQAFSTINSFLYRSHVQPLRTDSVAVAYDVLQESGLDSAETQIVELAIERAAKSAEAAKQYNKDKIEIGEVEIWGALAKYKERKAQLGEDLRYLSGLDDERRLEVLSESGRQSRRAAKILLAFFQYFDKTARPLVCARVAPGKFRVLGRSLINKRERTGLELLEATRNSPLGVLVEGGIAAVQAIRRDGREQELHELEVQKKKIQIAREEELLYQERLKTEALQATLAQQLDNFTRNTDMKAVEQLPDSFLKRRIEKAYGVERRNAGTLLYQQDLNLDEKSIKLIDQKV